MSGSEQGQPTPQGLRTYHHAPVMDHCHSQKEHWALQAGQAVVVVVGAAVVVVVVVVATHGRVTKLPLSPRVPS